MNGTSLKWIMNETEYENRNNTQTNGNIDWPYIPIQPKQGLILFLITLTGTGANITALLATLKLGVKQKNAINYLIIALTITDMYGIVLCTLPTLLCYLKRQWIGGLTMCNFQGVSTMFASLASGSLATAMAVERLFAIWKPFLYRNFATKRKTVLTILTIWTTSMIVALFPLSGKGNFVRNLTGTYCTVNWFAKKKENIAYASFYVVMGSTLLIIVLFCNINIAIHLLLTQRNRKRLRADSHRAQLKKTKSGCEDSDSEADTGNRKVARSHSDLEKLESTPKTTANALEAQLVKAVAFISILFIICWGPFMIRIICNLTGTWEDPWVDVQVSRLLLINFVLDPFLYTLSRKQCRDIVKSWFCCCCYSEGRRSSIFSRWFAVMRKKHGSFLSSSQTGSGHNVNSGTTISTVQLVHMKNASGDTTPSQSVSDVVVHTSMIHGPSNEQGILHDEATEPAQNGRPLAVTTDENEKDNDDSENEDNSETRPMHRLHSEVHRKESKQLEEKTASLPNLAEIGGERNDDEVKVDVGFLYDLAYQRQESK